MTDRRFAVDDPDPDYRLADESANRHYVWDADIEPALTVDPGAVVRFDCRDAYDRQLPREPTVEDVAAVDADGHPLVGPVAVDLKISEVVDAPNWTLTAYLPESVLD